MMLLLGVLFLCFGTGTLLPAHSTLEDQLAKLSQGLFEDVFRFPSDMDFPYDTMFSSWHSSGPDFHMLTELPPFMSVPRVQVLCNRSQLTVLVDKAYSGVQLHGGDLWLGDGCNVNGELHDQFVLTYDLNQCGTRHAVQSGLEIFSNFLHVNPKKSVFNWWPTPFNLPLSCTPNMPPSPPGFPFPVEFPREEWNFGIQPMNSFWTQKAHSTIYERGENIYLQVTAKAGPQQQPFIQACFVSASPDPHFQPRIAVVLNKGCVSVSSDSAPVLAEYAAPTREGAVNLVLNTSTLTAAVYMHCSVLMSSFGVTEGSKSCNYNKLESRWEELSGNVEVCSCCSTRCRALEQFNSATKAIITTGPLHLVEKTETAPLQSDAQPGDSSQISVAETMQSDAPVPAATEDATPGVRGRGARSDPNESPKVPRGVVVLSRGPAARLTMWLPMRRRAARPVPGKETPPSPPRAPESLGPEAHRLDGLQNDLPAPGEDLPLSSGFSKCGRIMDALSDADALKMQPLVDGWPTSASPEKSAILEESGRKRWGARPEALHDEAPEDDDDDGALVTLSEDAARQEERLNPRRNQRDVGGSAPVIRSRVQFTKGSDGSQTLSYEEDIVQRKDKPKVRRLGVDEMVDGNQKTGQRALYTFLELLGRMRAE